MKGEKVGNCGVLGKCGGCKCLQELCKSICKCCVEHCGSGKRDVSGSNVLGDFSKCADVAKDDCSKNVPGRASNVTGGFCKCKQCGARVQQGVQYCQNCDDSIFSFDRKDQACLQNSDLVSLS